MDNIPSSLAVAHVLPGVPHQLCHFHYLREATKPVYEADRHAKKELKKRLRGVRPLERAVEHWTDPEAYQDILEDGSDFDDAWQQNQKLE